MKKRPITHANAHRQPAGHLLPAQQVALVGWTVLAAFQFLSKIPPPPPSSRLNCSVPRPPSRVDWPSLSPVASLFACKANTNAAIGRIRASGCGVLELARWPPKLGNLELLWSEALAGWVRTQSEPSQQVFVSSPALSVGRFCISGHEDWYLMIQRQVSSRLSCTA